MPTTNGRSMPRSATGSISPSRPAWTGRSCRPPPGLIVADSFGAEILRDSALAPLAAARRKAVMLRFARAAAFRLHGLADPQGLPD